VYFSRNTPNNIKDQISEILGVNVVLGTCRYLGMSSMIGRIKKAIIGYLKDKMWKKVHSIGSVKFVVQAIAAYCMSTILLPNLGEELERMINSRVRINRQEEELIG
jgi:hypothetical protein